MTAETDVLSPAAEAVTAITAAPREAAADSSPRAIKRVLMVGCGNMGGALLARWVEGRDFMFTIVSPSGERPVPAGVAAAQGAKDLEGQRFDVLIVAVKPQLIDEVVPAYVPLLAENGFVVSIAAGYSVQSLQSVVGERSLLRVMPNLPVALGKGVSGLYADHDASFMARRWVERLMEPTGDVVWVDSEDQLDRVTAIAGSGPGYVFEIARCWAEAGERLGFDRDEARELVLKTLAGSVELALRSSAPLDDLREGVTSRNGTTEAGLDALNGDSQLRTLLEDTVDAAYSRALELR